MNEERIHHRRKHRRYRVHRRRRTLLPKNYVIDLVANTVVAAIYFVMGFLGAVLVPIRGIAGIGLVLLLILWAVSPDTAVYALLWAFGVGLLMTLIGPQLFSHFTQLGRGSLEETRAASRVRHKADIPTITLPDPDSLPSAARRRRH